MFRKEDLQLIWKWEVASGHCPSRTRVFMRVCRVQVVIATCDAPYSTQTDWSENTITHESKHSMSIADSKPRSPTEETKFDTYEVGAKCVYLDIQSLYHDVTYPPRPVPGSIADMRKACPIEIHF